MPARSIDTATIAFGLVSIPVKIYSTSEPSHELHFHLIHAGCGMRLKQQYVCEKHGKVDREEMIKGFEISKGNFVELDKEELKALDAIASDELAIREFVPAEAVDPIYIDNTYYLAPAKGGDRAYRLLRDALASANLVGIAAYAARGKQYVVMLRPYQDGIAMHQLRYPDEVKPWSEVPLGKLPKAAPAELGLAAKVIDQLRHETFDPSQYKDEVKDRVRKLITQKAKGGEIIAPPEVPKPALTDLMAALKASLAGNKPAAVRVAPASGHARPWRASNAHKSPRVARQRPHASRAPRPRAHPKSARR